MGSGYILFTCPTVIFPRTLHFLPTMQAVASRAYRPAEGGERACNSHTASTEGEMLAVTKNTLAVSL